MRPNPFFIALLFMAMAPQVGNAQATTLKSDKASRLASQDMSEKPVLDRTQPGFQAQGIKLGGLKINPTLRMTALMDSNIFAQDTDAENDLITLVNPSLKLTTTNPNHGFEVDASANYGFFAENSRENFDNYRMSFRPYLVITRAAKLRATMVYDRIQELRSDESTPSAADEPVTVTRQEAQLAWDYKPGRFGSTFFLQVAKADYTNVLSQTGTVLGTNDRNRNEYETGLKIGYDITDISTLYATANVFQYDYDRRQFNTGSTAYDGFSRDSKGVDTRVGLAFKPTSLISADVNAGYYKQKFSDTTFKAVTTGVGQAKATLQVTPMTDIGFLMARDVFETGVAGASAFIQDKVSISLAHELRRNIVATGFAELGHNDYQSFTRKDDYRSVGGGLKYTMNRFMDWRLNYIFDIRDSNRPLVDYERHRVFLGTAVRF